jgi:hypothetical protein
MVPDIASQTAPRSVYASVNPLIVKRIDAIPIAIPLKKPVIMAGVRLDVSYKPPTGWWDGAKHPSRRP